MGKYRFIGVLHARTSINKALYCIMFFVCFLILSKNSFVNNWLYWIKPVGLLHLLQ